MSFHALLIAVALAACLAVFLVAVFLLRLGSRGAAAKADADAKRLLAKANRELKRNPPRPLLLVPDRATSGQGLQGHPAPGHPLPERSTLTPVGGRQRAPVLVARGAN
ncbi:MAG: hypothetical protein V4713_05425 [Pseudomonadota bacterium]